MPFLDRMIIPPIRQVIASVQFLECYLAGQVESASARWGLDLLEQSRSRVNLHRGRPGNEDARYCRAHWRHGTRRAANYFRAGGRRLLKNHPRRETESVFGRHKPSSAPSHHRPSPRVAPDRPWTRRQAEEEVTSCIVVVAGEARLKVPIGRS